MLTLGLGIAASTAAFSAVEGVLLAPLPVEAEDDLVVFWQRSEARDFDHVPFLPSGFEAVAALDGPFQGVAAHETAGARPALGEAEDGTFAIDHVRVGGDFFGVLGARPALGRLLRLEDDVVGAAPAAVISHEYWVQSRGSDPSVLGSTLRYGGISYLVVGVAPPGFDYPGGAEAWATLRGSYPDWGVEEPSGIELDLVARLSPGVTPSAAFSAVDAALDATHRAAPGDLVTVGAGFRELVVGTLEPVLQTTMVAALGLLLVAVANATLLFLSGGTSLIHESALRVALGASPGRVLRPLLADAAIHAVLGVAVGVLLGGGAIDLLMPLAPNEFARFDQIVLKPRHVAFAVALGFVALIVSASLVGAWVLTKEPRAALMAGARSVAGGGAGLRRAIVVTQVALAVLASVGAGLLWQTVANLDGLDRGFDPEDLYVVGLTLPFSFFEMPDGYTTALEAAVTDLQGRPGVAAASPTLSAPLFVRGGIDFVPTLEGQSEEEARSNPFIGLDAVMPGYFDASGTRLVEGRLFGAEDGAGGAPSVIVNEATATALWPGRSALGRQINMGGVSRSEWRTVVGVVESQRFRSFPEVMPAAYLPLPQFDRFPPSRLVVRTDGGELPLRSLVTEAWSGHFPGVQVLTVESMDDLMAGPLLRPRFAASVLLVFALVMLGLTAIGVHGVFSVLVQERTRELGVRMALGASNRDIVRFMTARILGVGLIGGVLGVVLSFLAAGAIESLLFGVTARHIPTIAGAFAIAIILGLVAGAAPTLKALRTDAGDSLRAE